MGALGLFGNGNGSAVAEGAGASVDGKVAEKSVACDSLAAERFKGCFSKTGTAAKAAAHGKRRHGEGFEDRPLDMAAYDGKACLLVPGGRDAKVDGPAEAFDEPYLGHQ